MTISIHLILLMAIGTYLMRLAGLALAHRGLPQVVTRVLPLIPGALLAGLVVLGGLTTDSGTLSLDARVPGMLVAAAVALTGRSIGTVVVAGVVTTATVRLTLALIG